MKIMNAQSNKLIVNHRQSGFSLVEIMVGLVIGLLVTLVVMQVLSVYDTQRRTTEGGSDAQISGNVSFYTLASDLQMAAYGAMPDNSYSIMRCENVVYKVAPITSIDPVTLVDGVSDSITIRYGTAEAGGALVSITAFTGKTLTVKNSLGCNKDEIAFISSENGGRCAMSKIESLGERIDPVSNLTLYDITLTDDKAITNNAVIPNKSKLACVGSWYEITYSVLNGTLMKNGLPFMDGIVNIQAQYGISDLPTQNDITQWVDPTGDWAAPTRVNRNRIKAVRIAFVARNPQRSDKVVTGPCSSLTAPGPTGLCAWDASKAAGGSAAPAIDLSADPDWQHYRYQIFESVIPMRNVIRAKETLL